VGTGPGGSLAQDPVRGEDRSVFVDRAPRQRPGRGIAAGGERKLMVTLEDRAGLAPADREWLAREGQALTSLDRVLRWLGGHTPPSRVEEILTQDEYTHDVLVPWSEGRYLAFDTS